MEKEKQIEEIAREITDVWNNKCQFVSCNGCKYNDLNDNRCQEKLIADHLVSKGYRKQSEGEWIDLYKGKHTNPVYSCSICGKGTLLRPHIDELDNMVMVQALSPFCPRCGAKMKGGE